MLFVWALLHSAPTIQAFFEFNAFFLPVILLQKVGRLDKGVIDVSAGLARGHFSGFNIPFNFSISRRTSCSYATQ